MLRDSYSTNTSGSSITSITCAVIDRCQQPLFISSPWPNSQSSLAIWLIWPWLSTSSHLFTIYYHTHPTSLRPSVAGRDMCNMPSTGLIRRCVLDAGALQLLRSVRSWIIIVICTTHPTCQMINPIVWTHKNIFVGVKVDGCECCIDRCECCTACVSYLSSYLLQHSRATFTSLSHMITTSLIDTIVVWYAL